MLATRSLKRFFILLANIIVLSIPLLIILSIYFFEFLDNPHYLSQWLKQRFHQSIGIGKVELSWRGLNPVVKLEKLSLLDRQTKKTAITFNELELGVNLFQSLLHRQLISNLLVISGTKLSLIALPDGRYKLVGFNNLPPFSLNLNSVNFIDLHKYLAMFDSSVTVIGDDINLSFANTNLSHINFLMNLAKVKNDKLDLTTLYLNHMPLRVFIDYLKSNSTHQLQNILAHCEPDGEVNNFIFANDDTKHSYFFTGDITNLQFEAYQNIPSVNGISLHLFANQQGGSVRLIGSNAKIELPWYSQPIDIQKLDSTISWIRNKESTQINVGPIYIGKNNSIIDGDIHFSSYQNKDPQIKLLLYLHNMDMMTLKQYLPDRKLNPKLARWLQQALQTGNISQATVILKGPLNHFPFDDKSGNFFALGNFAGLNLNYKKGWPATKNLKGSIEFHNREMKVLVNSGTIYQAKIKQVAATIQNIGLKEKNALLNHLSVQAQVQGNLDQGLNFLLNSPLHKKIGDKLNNLAIAGPMHLALNLDIPLGHDRHHVVAKGVVETTQATLSLKNFPLHLTQLQGKFNFNNEILSAENLTADFYNQQALINVATYKKNADTLLQINASSFFNDYTLKKLFNISLDPVIAGSAPLAVSVNLPRHQSHSNFTITSTLQGLQINLPQSLGKDKQEVKKLKINTRFAENDIHISTNYDDKVSAAVIFNRANNQTYFYNGSLKINKGKASFIKTKGLVVHAALAKLDTKEWQNFFEQLSEANTKSLSRLASPVTNETSSIIINPSKLPSLKITIDKLQYAGKSLGSMLLKTTPTRDGLRIQKFVLNARNLNLVSRGYWHQLQNVNKTILQGRFAGTDLIHLLIDNNWPTFIDTRQFQGNFQLNWSGAPYQLDLSSLYGAVTLDMEKGRLLTSSQSLDASIDMGRMLTFLSLESLSRRLMLDFSDLTDKGYNFDSLKGNFRLNKEIISTQNMVIKGMVADVNLKGSANLLKKQLHLTAAVTPHLTSSFPVIAALAGGPIVGVATLIANAIVSPAIDQMAKRYYSIEGPWNKPLISARKLN